MAAPKQTPITRVLVTGMFILLSMKSWSVGTGDIKINSKLGQPLNAQFRLMDTGNLSRDQIIVTNAPTNIYRQMGVERTASTASIKFNLDDHNVVTITTDKPVKEPYLRFVLEVDWPNGRLFREFKLLLDPS